MEGLWKRFMLALILLAGVVLTGYQIYEYRGVRQEEISENVLRLHIRADDNTAKEQNLKIKVRDALLDKMAEYQDEITSAEDAKEEVMEHLGELEQCAENVVGKYNKNIDISVGQAWFPEKSYGDIVLPAGDYESVIVKIGSGEGKNWWCVLFPQLCFIDPVNGYIPEDEKENLKNELSDDAYDMLIDKRVAAKLKIVEWIKELRDF